MGSRIRKTPTRRDHDCMQTIARSAFGGVYCLKCGQKVVLKEKDDE